MNIKIDEISIEIKLSDKEKTKARVDLRFGEWEIRGFRLSVSEHENENLERQKLWLQPPSIPVGRTGKWFQIVRLDDKEQWKKFERIVFDKYTEEQLKNSKADDEIENLWDKDTI